MGKCRKCGARIEPDDEFCPDCGASQAKEDNAKEGKKGETAQKNSPKTKKRVTAGLLAIFLGGLGVHKFYLGKIGIGILYILFCWTYIPGIIGFIEGLTYLCSKKTDEEFTAKYAK